ncbi:hypothetical protein [Streptomyces sp. Amel2xC10]|uniref:hypothetical protein n=1 Tax=Streptomyces sp. Amel2xC10 TaxID=1305826 RepID=UPI000A08CBA8|nr:hypothetical protein [Streptomyces sp. Amel2xC10]SMF86382.1 hypothetical protein SAMN02745830_07159 [Streptomyces sp. Amel2xC10]
MTGFAGRNDNGQSARADLLNTFAAWFFTTGRGSRQAADQILGKHRAEVLREAAKVAADRVHLFAGSDEGAVAEGALEGLADLYRRMADEAQPVGPGADVDLTAGPCPLCPRCGEDLTEYADDDRVFLTGDARPYCSQECVVATWRASQKQQPEGGGSAG